MGATPGTRIGIGDPATEKQLDVIQAIIEYKVEFTYYPSLRELAARMNKSVGTIQQQLISLRRKGMIDWNKGEPRAFKFKTLKRCSHCNGLGFDVGQH